MNFLCLVSLRAQFLWSFPSCLETTGCSALWEEAGDSELPARCREGGRLNSRLEDLIRSVTCPQNPQMCRQMPFVRKSVFFIGMGICYFSNKPLCTFGQIVATLYCPVRSSYPQLHGIVNLIQILQGGLEIVLLSWRTFLLTDLHSAVHLWGKLQYVLQFSQQSHYTRAHAKGCWELKINSWRVI